MSNIQLLGGSPLFADLPEDALTTLSRAMSMRTFAANMILFHKGSPGQRLYLIEQGKIRIFSLSTLGRELTLNVLGPGDMFGELAVLDGQPRSAGAITLERTVVHGLERKDFLAFLDAYPQLWPRILELVTARLRRSTVYAESLAFLDVQGRISATLLDLADRYGGSLSEGVEIRLRLTQAELATYVAASRESVNKALSMLRDRGLVRIDGPYIVLLDVPALRDQALY